MHNNRVMTHDSLVYDEATNSRYKWYFVSKGNIPVAKTYEEYPLLEFAERLLLNRRIDLLYNLRESSLASQLVRMPNDGFMSAESRFPVNAYSSSNIAHYSIGQGDFQLTALQNAMIASSVLNRGVLYHPAVIASISFSNNEKTFVPNPEKDKIQVYDAATADQIKEAMKEVVERGTAGGLFHDIREGRGFYAKTGTAETEVYRDNSLFVGFVEFREGEPLIFSVIVPRSGQGARVAGKLTGQILSTIIAYENEKGKRL
jgi:cell division protein FtsI/penicillin-binding protein 2